jgi:hypothetical protein
VPAYIAERAALRAGDYLFIRLTDAGDIVIKAVKPRNVHQGYLLDESPKTDSVPTDAVVLAKW